MNEAIIITATIFLVIGLTIAVYSNFDKKSVKLS
jgi:hypothetical protein